MMSPEEIAETRRLFFGEHWKIGTISAHLGRHTDAIRRALNADSFSRKGRYVPRMTDRITHIFENTDFRTSDRKLVLPTLSVLQSGAFQIGVS